jgi:nucleoside-diphosphate-sugar epimerase
MVLGFYKNGKIPIMRDGQQWRPFVHIEDTSHAFITTLQAEPEIVNGQTFNVSSDNQNVQIINLARIVADSINLPFNYEWYGAPDKRSYRVSFGKIQKTLGYRTTHTPKDGAKEVFDALKDKKTDPDDPKTITVKWYSHLLEMQSFLKSVEIDGSIL